MVRVRLIQVSLICFDYMLHCSPVNISQFHILDVVFGYYSSWAIYRSDKFSVHDIDATKYSHLTYAYVGLNEDGSIRILDPWADIELGESMNDFKWKYRKFIECW